MSDKGFYTPKSYQTPSASQFKTPLPYSTPKPAESSTFATPMAPEPSSSDSESSMASSGGENLSIVAEFDDLIRSMQHKRNAEVEDAFQELAEKMEEMTRRWIAAVEECRRLRQVVETKTQEYGDLEGKLCRSRKLLDLEKKHTRKAEEERDQLEEQLAQVRELLLKDKRNHLAEETKEKLSFLGCNGQRTYMDTNGVAAPPQLSAIQEINTTGSLLSDFSYSRSEDDLDTSLLQCGKTWKKHRPSADHPEPAAKRRKSSDTKVVEISTSETVRATTTLTVHKEGPITATSIIESVPNEKEMRAKSPGREGFEGKYRPTAPPAETIYNLWQADLNHNQDSPKQSGLRSHAFQTKTVVMPDNCGVCEKRIGFGRSVAKCAICRTICHLGCKGGAPLPCVPAVSTPTTQRGLAGYIRDYTPTIPPMVPALIVHCINEIESRGLQEIGLYRVPGSEKDVKSLKEKFLRQRGAPSLKDVDVNVLCGTVKDFLRSLQEPLITHKMWHDFVRAVELRDEQDRRPALYQAISELPQPNRDTLAYMILHLKKIAASKECKMPIENLAKVFGPTIVGYSSENTDNETMFRETAQQAKVMEYLIALPTDYWASFINVEQAYSTKLQQTPSTDSLLRTTGSRGIFTPNSRTAARKKQKIFATPPSSKK